MDESFVPLGELLPELLPFIPDLVDEQAGVRTSVSGYDVSTPVELDISVGPDGAVRLGGAPPLYHVATSFLPVLHSVRLLATQDEEHRDGES